MARTLTYAFLSLILLTAGAVRADVKLPALFSDGAVLQAHVKVPVWGWAEPGEKITVAFEKQHKSAKADAQRHWRVELSPLEPGGPYELTVTGNNTLTVKDVLVGEVWVASGQSNMEYGLGSALNPKEEATAADYPLIHVFTVKTVVATTPQDDVTGQWQVCTPQNAMGFTATGYFFARDLHKALKVPVALIHSSVSGTWAETWISTKTQAADPNLAPTLEWYANEYDKPYPKQLADFQAKLAEWNIAAAKAIDEKKQPPARPNAPEDPATSTRRPGGLFNGKIAPLTPYRIKGVIWYQGEYNGPWGEHYRRLFPALITDWRRQWQQGDFPFLFVQLANLNIPAGDFAHYDEVREAQLMTLALPNTGMAVAADVGDANNIHPPNKQEIGRRLMLSALAVAYGKKDVVYSGPLYQSMSVKGGKVYLKFSQVGGGLVSKSGEKLGSFIIAGEDRKFVAADAVIDGKMVVVSSPDVANPVAVRYAWADNPVCTLFNQGGLPASPFRTDDWPAQTTGKRPWQPLK